MAANFPGPYELEIFYTAGSLLHVQRLNCDTSVEAFPGDPLTTTLLNLRGGGTQAVDLAISTWIVLLAPMYNVANTFDSANLWKYTAGTFDRVFINAQTIGLPGLSATATNNNHQSTYTFRTLEGNNMKIVLLDDVRTSEIREPYGSLTGSPKALMDFVSGTTNFLLARDTSYPIASLNVVGGQNEALFKIRNR